MKTINYNYYHFGPFLYSTRITEDEIKTMLDICEKQKGPNLKGKQGVFLEGEYNLPIDLVMNVLNPYYQSYCKALFETRGVSTPELKMTGVWVNYMTEGEFNPPHIHTCKNSTETCFLSCAVYLNVPDDMTEQTTSYGSPGAITFTYGEALKNNQHIFTFTPKTGDFFIFPGWLNHYVNPFKSKDVRISVSANLEEVKP